MRPAISDQRRVLPPLHFREIATICWARFGYRLSHHTVRRVLAEHPSAPRTSWRFLPDHAIPDAVARQQAVLPRHVEGWNKASIAAYLEISRSTVHDLLRLVPEHIIPADKYHYTG